MPWMVCLPLGIRTIKNIGTSAKENIMAKFFKDPDGKLIAALGDDVATPAGCTELTANTEDAAHEKHVPVVETERDGHVIVHALARSSTPACPNTTLSGLRLRPRAA